jgi:catechol 2,3-dioxygenase-like lactoylglutathione lyase family enzyme
MRYLVFVLALALGMFACSTSDRAEPMATAARACTKESELGCPRPIFSVGDLRASEAYYRDSLGFKVDWEDGDPADFGAVSRSGAQVFLCRGCPGAPGAWAWVSARDVDKLYAEIVEKGAIIKQPPTNMPWRMRELHVADRDGNVIRFASPIDH